MGKEGGATKISLDSRGMWRVKQGEQRTKRHNNSRTGFTGVQAGNMMLATKTKSFTTDKGGEKTMKDERGMSSYQAESLRRLWLFPGSFHGSSGSSRPSLGTQILAVFSFIS